MTQYQIRFEGNRWILTRHTDQDSMIPPTGAFVSSHLTWDSAHRARTDAEHVDSLRQDYVTHQFFPMYAKLLDSDRAEARERADARTLGLADLSDSALRNAAKAIELAYNEAQHDGFAQGTINANSRILRAHLAEINRREDEKGAPMDLFADIDQ